MNKIKKFQKGNSTEKLMKQEGIAGVQTQIPILILVYTAL